MSFRRRRNRHHQYMPVNLLKMTVHNSRTHASRGCPRLALASAGSILASSTYLTYRSGGNIVYLWYWPLSFAGATAVWFLSRWFGQQFARQDNLQMPPWHDWIWLAAVAVIAGSKALSTPDSAVRIFMAAYLLLTAWVDRWTGYIPDTAHVAAISAIIGIRLLTRNFSFWSLASGILLGIAVLILGMIVKDGIGGGDIKLCVVLGLAFGFVPGAGVFWLANVLALLYVLVVRLFSHRVAAVRMGPWFLISYTLTLMIPPGFLPDFLRFVSLS